MTTAEKRRRTACVLLLIYAALYALMGIMQNLDTIVDLYLYFPAPIRLRDGLAIGEAVCSGLMGAVWIGAAVEGLRGRPKHRKGVTLWTCAMLVPVMGIMACSLPWKVATGSLELLDGLLAFYLGYVPLYYRGRMGSVIKEKEAVQALDAALAALEEET